MPLFHPRSVALVALSVAALVACGDDPTSSLSPEAETGRQIADSAGCMSCHRSSGDQLGPAWDGLWGSTVELEGGGTAVFDADFVTAAVRDPSAQRPAGGDWVQMPAYPVEILSDEDLAAIVTYLQALGPS